MSKARATARAQREATAAQKTAAERTAQTRAAADRARRERRSLTWRRLRLWQHGSGFSRRRETIGAVVCVVMVVLVVAFLFTRSVTTVIATALVCVLAGPILALLLSDRSR